MIDLHGQRFGRLVVIARSPRRVPGNVLWLCRCDCGQTHVVPSKLLRHGKTRSCGCLRAENIAAYATRHGLNKSPEHRTWVAMRQRCLNPNDTSFAYYGGRGISICDRWLYGEDGRHPFECFYEDMGQKPYPEATIDRKNPDGPYEPGNCRWASRKEQSTNQRRFQEATSPV